MPYVSAIIDRIHFVRWINPLMEDVDPLVREVIAARKELGEPVFGIAIVPVDCPPPTDDVRAAWTKRVSQLLEAAESLHFVIEGSGFRLTIMRSALTTITFLSANRGRVLVHSSVTHALHRIESRLTMKAPRILELLATKLPIKRDLLNA